MQLLGPSFFSFKTKAESYYWSGLFLHSVQILVFAQYTNVVWVAFMFDVRWFWQ